MRWLCPASLLSKIEQASQAEAARQGAWSNIDKIYIFEILAKNCSKYLSASPIWRHFSKIGHPYSTLLVFIAAIMGYGANLDNSNFWRLCDLQSRWHGMIPNTRNETKSTPFFSKQPSLSRKPNWRKNVTTRVRLHPITPYGVGVVAIKSRQKKSVRKTNSLVIM